MSGAACYLLIMGPTTGGKAEGIAGGLIEAAEIAGGGYDLGTIPDDLKNLREAMESVVQIVAAKLGPEYNPLVRGVVQARILSALAAAFSDLSAFALGKGVITGTDEGSKAAIKQFDAADIVLAAIEYKLTGIQS